MKRVTKDNYVIIKKPDHPNARQNGWVFEHVVVVSRALGKPIPDRACVHHINGDRMDNQPENLILCEDDAYHMLLHQRQRALDACGHAGWRKCTLCGEYDDPETMQAYGSNGYRHARCHAADMLARRRGQDGELIYRDRVTEKDVREIRRRYENEDITQRELSEDYPVSPSMISKIINRVHYSDV